MSAEAEPQKGGYPNVADAGKSESSSKKHTGKDIAAAFNKFFLTADFWEKNWEQYPVHHRRADGGEKANLFPESMAADDIADLIRRCGSSLKVFRRGESCSDEDNFMVAYLDEASLVVNTADRYHPRIYEFCRELQEHWHHVFGVIYLTPPNSYAVGLHNDDQDVFLMQVWGKKHWTVRDAAPCKAPYTEEMLGKDAPVPEEYISEPIMTFDIEPGDILYIPRGFLHSATTTAEPSLHITITMPTSDYCWGVQLIKHLMQEIHSRDVGPEIQKACHTRLIGPEGSLDSAAVESGLQEIFNNWSSNISIDKVLDAFEGRMERVNEGQERAHRQAMSIKPTRPHVTDDCRVRLMNGISCSCEPDSEVVVFKRDVGGGDVQRLELPIAKSSNKLIRSLTARPQRVKELPCDDVFERLCVLELLHRQGILQIFLRDADELTIS